MQLRIKHIYFIVLSILIYNQSFTQVCTADNFSITYQLEKNALIVKTAINQNAESFMSGLTQIFDLNNYQAGFVTKLTKSGSVLWSKRYLTEDYNSSYFVDIVALDDGGFIGILNSVFIDSISFQTKSGNSVLVRANKYGNVVWTRVLSETLSVSYTEIDRIANDQLLLRGGVGLNPGNIVSPSYILKMDLSGNVLFKTTLSLAGSSLFFLSTARSLQLRNGDIVLGFQVASYTGNTVSFPLSNVGYLFVKLSLLNGSVQWHNTYLTNPARFSVSVDDRLDEIKYISEMPNGTLKFYTSFTDFPPFYSTTYKYGLVITTNDDGTIISTESFYNRSFGFRFLDGKKQDTSDILHGIDYAFNSVLFKLNKNGDIGFEKTYLNYALAQTPNSFNVLDDRYSIFSNNSQGIKTFRLVRTKKGGSMPCEDSPSNMFKQAFNNLFVFQNMNLATTIDISGTLLNTFKIVSNNFPITMRYDCEPFCCKDTLDFANSKTIKLCDSLSYRLPNGDMVKDSGTYYIKYPKLGGCDSVLFYRVLFTKSIKPNLGEDTCFNKKDDSLWLAVPKGMDEYKWQNQIGGNVFLAKQPGTYWVQTKNFCGIFTDSITIFNKCDFNLYIPDAFTPNGDGLNDFFGLPRQNKFKIELFEIYDRWSNKLFSTTAPSQNWDGTVEGQKVNSGIYIYQFRLKALDGRSIAIKGRLLLIR